MDGNLTLREAIMASNADAIVGDSVVAGDVGLDTILFDPGLAGFDIDLTIQDTVFGPGGAMEAGNRWGPSAFVITTPIIIDGIRAAPAARGAPFPPSAPAAAAAGWVAAARPDTVFWYHEPWRRRRDDGRGGCVQWRRGRDRRRRRGHGRRS